MIGVVVVTHGQLATELVNAAETIVGDLPDEEGFGIPAVEDVADVEDDGGDGAHVVIASAAKQSSWIAASLRSSQ